MSNSSAGEGRVEDRDWSSEFYQVSLTCTTDYTFVQKVFSPGPALVARTPKDGLTEFTEYRGQAYDASRYELREGTWDHQPCYICTEEIANGCTYWEHGQGIIICDVCHEHIQSQNRQAYK